MNQYVIYGFIDGISKIAQTDDQQQPEQKSSWLSTGAKVLGATALTAGALYGGHKLLQHYGTPSPSGTQNSLFGGVAKPIDAPAKALQSAIPTNIPDPNQGKLNLSGSSSVGSQGTLFSKSTRSATRELARSGSNQISSARAPSGAQLGLFGGTVNQVEAPAKSMQTSASSKLPDSSSQPGIFDNNPGAFARAKARATGQPGVQGSLFSGGTPEVVSGAPLSNAISPIKNMPTKSPTPIAAGGGVEASKLITPSSMAQTQAPQSVAPTEIAGRMQNYIDNIRGGRASKWSRSNNK